MSELDLHLSDSDQSDDNQTNTSTDVLDGDYLTRSSNIFEVSVNVHEEDEEEIAETNVPDIEHLEESVPEIIVTAEDENYIDEYLEQMEGIDTEDILEDSQASVYPASDQGAEEYVIQFIPDIQIEDSN